ncbi:MAG: hypothetical protein AB1627_11115 [Chloroflexota bacterium]
MATWGGVADRPLIRFAALATTAVLLTFGALEGILVVSAAVAHPHQTVALDLRLYVERAASWLGGDGFYLERQLTGQAYEITPGDALYPPPILLLLVPITVLPWFLWWVVPLTVVAASLWRLAPGVRAWPLLALVLCYPRTWEVLVYGNPSMWMIAAVFAGAAWGWPAVFALLKPTLAPFALVWARSRRWWLALVILLLVGVPFAGLWVDYLVAIRDAVNPYGPEYLLGEWPIALASVVAWFASPIRASRQRRDRPFTENAHP